MLGLSKPVARACALFDSTDADTPPSLAEVARRVGLSSGALSKRFIAELGVNPRDWLTARKRQRFRKALRDGEKVADALYGAGYGSPSRVYETSDKALGMTPATYAKGGAGAHIDYTTVDSDYGRVLVAATQKGIAAVFLGDNDRTLEKDLQAATSRPPRSRATTQALAPRVRNVLARLYGRKPSALDAPDVPLDIVGTAFQWKVWKALTEIPPGQTRTYGEIAQTHRRARGAPAPSAAPAPPTRRPASFPAIAPSARSGALTGYRWGRGRARSGCWPTSRGGGAAARRRRRRRHGADAPARTARTRAAVVGAVQPADEFGADAAAQHAAALQAHALAGDDQDDAQVLRDGAVEKSDRPPARRPPASCRAGRATACGHELAAAERARRCRGRNSDRRAPDQATAAIPARRERDFWRRAAARFPSAFGLGTAAGLGRTGRLRPASGFTPAMAAANRSTSLAMAFRLALAERQGLHSRHGPCAPAPLAGSGNPTPTCRPACSI